MYITCKCLNVSVKTRGNELKELNPESINDLPKNNDMCNCNFFNLPLATTNELEEINKEQCCLIKNNFIGLWCVIRCINCSMYTHAVHRNYGAAFILINKNMITSNDKTQLDQHKLHPHYSDIFRIIIDYNQLTINNQDKLDDHVVFVSDNHDNHDDDDNDDDNDNIKNKDNLPIKYTLSQQLINCNNNLQLALNNLQEQLDNGIQKKSKLIDDKIQQFTNEQYQLLDNYRERAHVQYNLLSRIICDNNQKQRQMGVEERERDEEKDSMKKIEINVEDKNLVDNKSMSRFRNRNKIRNDDLSVDGVEDSNCRSDGVDGDYEVGVVLDETMGLDEGNLSIGSVNMKSMKREVAGGEEEEEGKRMNFNGEVSKGCYDCGETMFAFEGMDDTINTEHLEIVSEMENSDAEDSGQDEGIHIPRGQRGGHPTLAKSLPVSVPNFSTFACQSLQESDDDQLSIDPFDPHNIRASIKALARSVHGDTVFGDLPRPRFSTQI